MNRALLAVLFAPALAAAQLARAPRPHVRLAHGSPASRVAAELPRLGGGLTPAALEALRGLAAPMTLEGPVLAVRVEDGVALLPLLQTAAPVATVVPLDAAGAPGAPVSRSMTPASLEELRAALSGRDEEEVARRVSAAFDGAGPRRADESAAAVVPVPEAVELRYVPEIPAADAKSVAPYLEMRTASFLGWHPKRREMLISTRFGESAQLHAVKQPGGDRRQLTFFKDAVASGKFTRRSGGQEIVYMQDSGGDEYYQIHKLDLATGKSVRLTAGGKTRNGAPKWTRDGKSFAYTSTRRNGKDNDIWLMDPDQPEKTRLVAELPGHWSVGGWSRDDKTIIAEEWFSNVRSRLHLIDVATGQRRALTPEDEPAVYGEARFARGGRFAYAVSNSGSERQRLVRVDLQSGAVEPVAPWLPWDVEDYSVSPDGRRIAVVTNEAGASVLRLISARTGRLLSKPELPLGVIGTMSWHKKGRDLGFTFSSAKSAGDAYSLDSRTGKVRRWTESETGGLDASKFPEPELVEIKSFDGETISGFLYKPDPARFPGPRPLIVNIHGGPEGQSRPSFMGRTNYHLNELGVAVLFPNVRGSTGYGKRFLDLDNGFKREDSVKDIGAFLDWTKTRAELDASRVMVMGGSYGGYMTLASLMHFSDKLVGGIDLVGISNFVTFLENTNVYRRDLRRAEYGDERDPEMRAFQQRISPTNNVDKITKPLFIAQGLNDPRVPASEAEQMVKAMKDAGREVWYMLAKNEGHGFANKKNADYFFLAVLAFAARYLLGREAYRIGRVGV